MWPNFWKSLSLISCLIICTRRFIVSDTAVHRDDLLAKFKQFVVRYNRSYVNNPTEFQYRMSVFQVCQESLERQAKLNKRELELKGKAVYGVNKFSDWTKQEFLGRLSKFSNESVNTNPSSVCCQIEKHEPGTSSWDWRKKNKVTSVKNQGDCGSCWAFASTGIVETQWAIVENLTSPLELSVQEFVSCSGNAGCYGGSIEKSLHWLANATYYEKGKRVKYYLLPASEYPYEEKESHCHYDQIVPKTGAKIECACHMDFKGQENILANYVLTNGSVAVGVDAVLWHDYVGGIIQHHCTGSVIDHAVIIEGFDMSGDIPYWIVRNSWGTDFGINGYLHIKMYDNICGIAELVSYVRI